MPNSYFNRTCSVLSGSVWKGKSKKSHPRYLVLGWGCLYWWVPVLSLRGQGKECGFGSSEAKKNFIGSLCKIACPTANAGVGPQFQWHDWVWHFCLSSPPEELIVQFLPIAPRLASWFVRQESQVMEISWSPELSYEMMSLQASAFLPDCFLWPKAPLLPESC